LGQAEAVALPGGAQRPVRDAQFLAGLVDADLGGPLPGLLGCVPVVVVAVRCGPPWNPWGWGRPWWSKARRRACLETPSWWAAWSMLCWFASASAAWAVLSGIEG
jgi:hypothetical protein